MSERARVMRVIARMNVGGPAVQVTGLMRELDHERFDQRLYTGWCDGDEADYLLTQAPDVPAHRVPGLGRAVRPGDDARALAHLVRAIREFRPHVIHTHTAKAGVVGRSAAIMARSRAARVHTFHGHLLGGYFSARKTRMVAEVESQLARRTDALVAVGAQVREDLLAAGVGRREQYRIIEPGLAFPTPPPKHDARASFGLSADQLVIGFVGRLTAIKRVDRFAEAIGLLERSGRRVTCLVAGDGDSAPQLRAAIAEHGLPIRILGWRDDVERIIAACDVLALTSDNEGTPISLIQAAHYGVPVVATDVGSVHDIVADGLTGILCAPNAEAIADALAVLFDDSALRATLGRAACAGAQERFSVRRLADDHAELYSDLTPGRA